MKRALRALALVAGAAAVPALAQDTPDSVVTGTQPFEMRVLATGFDGPWELTWGPDDMLWVTERIGRRIVHVDPDDGGKAVLASFPEAFAPGGQDGLLGMALHPELLQGTGNDFVYAVYTYVDRARGADATVTDPNSPYRSLYTKIVRLTWDPASGTLKDPVDVIAGLPASNDHNAGRLKIGPDGKLYVTIGDGGKDQLGNWCLPIEAQRLPTADELAAGDFIAYQGKSLRLELDGSIPADNPEIGGVRSHVYTWGHRNPQGLAFAPDGTLYSSEQGPKTDDEVNVLEPGGNYGWPHVAGFRDDKAYQFARWADATTPCGQLEFSDISIHPSVPVENETDWAGAMVDPLATMFTVPSDWDFTDPVCGGIDFICWPTVAPSSIEAYMPASGGIPGWENSLITTTLKRGSLYRLPLAADGRSLRGPIERYFQSEDRFRDTALSPDMLSIYVATDSGGLAEKLAGGVTFEMQHPGAILVFTYARGDAAAASSVPPASVPSDVLHAAITGRMPQFTAAQVERGRAAYSANCVACHGANLLSAHYGPPLAGQVFASRWSGRSVAELFAHSHDKMPPSRPGVLSDDTYADLTALILSVNGFAKGEAELPADPAELGGMTIELTP